MPTSNDSNNAYRSCSKLRLCLTRSVISNVSRGEDDSMSLGFEAFKAFEVQELTDLKSLVAKKSNIKDVCALLDMKSSK